MRSWPDFQSMQPSTQHFHSQIIIKDTIVWNWHGSWITLTRTLAWIEFWDLDLLRKICVYFQSAFEDLLWVTQQQKRIWTFGKFWKRNFNLFCSFNLEIKHFRPRSQITYLKAICHIMCWPWYPTLRIALSLRDEISTASYMAPVKANLCVLATAPTGVLTAGTAGQNR